MSSQVKRKAAEADEMIRQLAAQGSGEQAMSTPDTSDESEAQPMAEVIEMGSEGSQDSFDTGESAESASGIEREIAELREEARKADARWRSLQGQVDSKDRQIEQLHALLANMQSAKPEKEAEPDVPMGFTQADKDAFGDDMIDLMQRIANQAASEREKAQQAKINELERQLAGVSQITASTVNDSFEAKLTELAPNWETYNRDQAFIDWLNDNPTRRQLFDGSAQSKNAKGVAEFFNMYAALTGASVNTEAQDNKRRKLENQVAPGKTRAPAPSSASTPEEKIWTRSQIAEVYRSKGRMSAEEFAKKEREISVAMQQERVDYTR